MNSIEIKLMDKTCRICLSESDNMKWLFENIDTTHRTFADVLENVLNLSLKLDDTRPQQVCDECQHVLILADDFKRKCLRSEAVIDSNFKHQTTVLKPENDLEQPYQCSICMMKFADLLLLGSHVIYHQHDQPFVKSTELNTNTQKSKDISLPNVKEENPDDFFDDTTEFDTIGFKEEDSNSLCHEIEISGITAYAKNDLFLTCVKCKRKFDNLESYQIHEKSHCTQKQKVQKPRKEKLKENIQYKCLICEKEFKKKSKLLYHLKTHDKMNVTYPCKTCKLVFKHQAFLENHILALHTKEQGYECEVCSKSFSTEDSLQIHKDSHKLKKHFCKYCEKGFVMLSTLNDHLRTHTGEKPFLCNICGRNFSQKNNLLQHVKRHKGLKSFSCDQCDKSFVSKGELVSHQRKHSGAHPFVCDDCGKGFTTASSLVKHKRIHTGEKPYACDLCSMRFSVLGTLKNHRRRHTGEKPFQCSHCERAFIQKNDLVSHIRCHTGERPFVCSHCGQSFRKSSTLKTHAKLHLKGAHLRDNLALMQGLKVVLNITP